MQIYLSVTPAHQSAAARHTQNLAHVAYRIGQNSTLLRQNFQSRGGLLSISDLDAPQIQDPAALCAAVGRECARRSYVGVVLDFEEPPTPDRRAFVQALDREAKKWRLFVPQSYGADAPEAVMFLCSALSGGNFREYLREWGKKRGAEKLALDVERLRMDFPLPCPSGVGTPLSGEELQKRLTANTFFSPELCARYCTYTDGGAVRFLLYDDAETMNRKVRIAEELGFCAAFFTWPEAEDIAGKLRW